MTTPSDLFFAAWCECTGQEPDKRIFKQSEHVAWAFMQAGFTCDELKKVVSYMKHENTKGGRFKIQLHKVAGELDRFASILADIKAKERNRRPPPTPKEQVIALRDPLSQSEEAQPRANGAGFHFKDVLKKLAEQ